jgi:membrane protein YdbS with pleckstrin-like domain
VKEKVHASLSPDEKILYKVRKHWVYLVGTGGVVLGISYALAFLFKTNFVLLCGVFLAIYFFMNWKNNLWVITNKRLIGERGVFTKNVMETPLEKINNVIYKKDPIGMIFNYGTVYVESAAKEGVMVMNMVPYPEKFLQRISEAKQERLLDSLMECPYCKEVIKKGAIRCRYCGADLRESYEMEQEKILERKEDVTEERIEEKFIDEREFTDERVEGNIYRRKVDFDLR